MHTYLERRARTDRIVGSVVFAVVAIVLLVLFAGCASSGQQPVVGFATVRGDGDIRADLSKRVVALGQVEGETGLFLPGSGFPLTMPLRSVKGGWLTRDASGLKREGKINEQPMPYWIVDLYRPGELELIAQHLGYSSILIEPKPAEGVADAPPTP